MSELSDKVKIGNKTFYFYECPNCGSRRKLDKNGIKATVLMGGGTLAALFAIFAFIGTIGLPYWILLVVGGRKFFESFDHKKMDEAVNKLKDSIPIFKKLEDEGVAIFRCPQCGNNEIFVED